VKFSLHLPGHGKSFIVAEIPTRKTFPLSVFTFLTLVESGFYGDMDFVREENGVLLVGSSSTDGVNIDEKLKSLGFLGGYSLYFLERSPSYPCGSNYLGFLDRGPGFHIHISSDAEYDVYGSCFAQVVRGIDMLPLIEEVTQKGETVKILSATVLLLEEDWTNAEM
jgi:hypothetical protein